MPATLANARTNDVPHSKIKIILAAEELFADRGIEAVSLREIAAKAGHRNNNAVKYHFDSKEGLVQAIFAHRVREMDGPRRSLLAQADAAGQLADPLTLLRILCLPLLDLVSPAGRHTYAAFMNQYLTRYRSTGLRHAADEISQHTSALRRLLALIAQRVSYLPKDLAESRIVLCHLMFVNMLIRSDSDKVGLNNTAAFQERIEDTLEMMRIALCAPYHRRRA